MRCRALLLALLPLLACSREAPAPPATPEKSRPATATASAAPATADPSYDQALIWLKTAKHFSFVLTEDGVHAEGEMTRPRLGAEVVEFRAGGEEWRGEATPQGLAWRRRSGSGWSDAPPPAFAGRLYQRVTIGFDPQKKEGSAQLVSREGGVAVFRFTDANTGDVWEVRVRPGNTIERIAIGDRVDLRITG